MSTTMTSDLQKDKAQTQSQVIKTVFGREIDLTEIEGFDFNEILSIEQDLLKVENGDPNYTYGWMNTKDPACNIKLRKGIWELVTKETDPEIVTGAIYDEKEYRVNELVLVRMPIRKWQALQAAITLRAARRELNVQKGYEGRVEDEMRRMGMPASKAQAQIHENEDVMTKDEAVGLERQLAEERRHPRTRE